jgi:hypothetical protein
LLWGNLMTGLLLGTADRPAPREIARRANAAATALLQVYSPSAHAAISRESRDRPGSP